MIAGTCPLCLARVPMALAYDEVATEPRRVLSGHLTRVRQTPCRARFWPPLERLDDVLAAREGRTEGWSAEDLDELDTNIEARRKYDQNPNP